MSITTIKPTYALMTTGVAVVALLTPVATATAATPAAQAKASNIRYNAEVVGPRATPTEYTYGTQARGLSNAGEVLVTSSSQPGFVAGMRGVRELASTEHLSQNWVSPRTMSASGQVYGSGFDGIFRWAGSTVALRPVRSAEQTSFQGYGLGAVNSRGDVAGCAYNYRVASPIIGSFDKATITSLTWPQGFGNCSVSAISDSGVATVNQEAPNYRVTEVYPRAATMTTAGVTYLKTPAGAASSADGISPNGSYVVGRVTKDGVSTVSWLSTRANPVALRGAGAMTPKLVTNDRVIVGVDNGRVVTWANGRRTDLTSVSRLPRGWVLSDVAATNQRGQYAVTATLPGGTETVAMRLTPTRR